MPAKTNAELVAHGAGILTGLGATVASAAEARAMLELA
ncbi:3-keto-5-aminohexanoate cleavage protein [Bradyrhizobium japonicum]|nr:3-keto-5-aminohexanoate cleavage protein [Bradyrhizobium japonicum]